MTPRRVKVSILGPERGPTGSPHRETELEKETTLAHNFERGAHPNSHTEPYNPPPLTPSEALRLKHQHLQSISVLSDQFGAKIVDVSENSVIVELTAKTNRIVAFLNLVKPFGILKSAQTGFMTPIMHS
ncbi:uncharacterized protein F5891DRAFT_1194556 [Suillus fuscotomentosus]|uniref:Acetolactate synthase small subunit n=2 Tax=Suillus TaxID=5379 RepID=A0A9P7EY85_9AGAM|nr:uncharacterized protein F5891DRAFT_1194556 [Suillus fuscotomentosus]XP_041287820.1 uncharacterized protein F5147DRAFT_819336 [Suillus discolor]KAG1895051.1 hypothetical protein F5891DRAFT_1194556 [Suillus fuscotomentosus]KAG2095305.1 hypothetical protein F5147DRAFT_819336 [Suillus discolor]